MSLTKTYASYYYRFDNYLTNLIARHFPFAQDHLDLSVSSIITKLFVVILVLILAYEAIFYLGVKLNFWEDPAKEFFIDKPVHCAHVYAKVNFVISENSSPKYSELTNSSNLLLKKPLKYHIEFGPDDYDYTEDIELGSTVGFLINKLLNLAKESAFISQSSYQIEDGLLFYKKQLKNNYKKDALCLQQIETGKQVEFFVLVRE